MTTLVSLRRRLALTCAAAACAVASLGALATVDAHAAATQASAAQLGDGAAKQAAPRASNFFWNNTAIAFRNSYGKTVRVAVAVYNTDKCGVDGGNYETIGWYVLQPGDWKLLINTTARYAYYYAKADDGATWSGDYGNMDLFHSAFDSCIGLGSTAAYDRVGLVQIDTKGQSYKEITLIP